MILKFVLIGLGMVSADCLMKVWVSYGYSLKGVGLIVYILAITLYIMSLTYYGKQLASTNFSIATTLPILINIIAVALITVLYYKESLSLFSCIGTLLAFIAVIFFALG